MNVDMMAKMENLEEMGSQDHQVNLEIQEQRVKMVSQEQMEPQEAAVTLDHVDYLETQGLLEDLVQWDLVAHVAPKDLEDRVENLA